MVDGSPPSRQPAGPALFQGGALPIIALDGAGQTHTVPSLPSPACGRGKGGDVVREMTEPDLGRGPSVRGVPEGDNRERMICADCGFILYDNPKIVVGSVARWSDRVLLCRRAINPRRGFWTLPAGYLELNESTSAGAEREAWEEARAKNHVDGRVS